MDLDDILICGKVKRARRLLVYGVPGIGKTTFASKAPDCIFLPTEDGSWDLDVKRTPLIEDPSQLIDYIDMIICKNAHKNVILDTIDGLEPLIWKMVVDQINAKEGKEYKVISDIGWQQGYDNAAIKWGRLLRTQFDRLIRHGINVILLGHSDVAKFTPPDGDGYSMYTPRVHKKATYEITAWCDEVLFANFVTKTIKGANNKVQAIGKGERVMYCQPKPHFDVKNRLNLPAELPFDYDEYAQFLGA